MEFRGSTIPGVVALIGADHTQDGKWSATTYRLEISESISIISGRDGFESGGFREGLSEATGLPTDRWVDVANALGVGVAEVRRFLRVFRPNLAEILDKIEEDLSSLDESSSDGATVVALSFGAPTNRSINAGYWSWPVRVVDQEGKEVGRVTPDRNGGWVVGNPAVTGGVKVLELSTSPGRHGGYVSLRLAVPTGTVAVAPEIE